MENTEIIEEIPVRTEKQIKKEAYDLAWTIFRTFLSSHESTLTLEEIFDYCSSVLNFPVTIEDIESALGNERIVLSVLSQMTKDNEVSYILGSYACDFMKKHFIINNRNCI